jgi:hypothetical protein
MNDNWRLSEDAQLSIDFIIGFTIFMIAFIFVATMMSGLLVNLQSQTIDYDAVAYRTGVMLTEDPGNPYNPDNIVYWNLLDLTTHRDEVERLGLSIGRNSPAILQQAKIDKFFSSSSSSSCESNDEFCFPADYRQKLIFGDYPYNFNISLKEIDGDDPWSVGPEPPDNRPYGYARRAVLIKKPSVAPIAIHDDTSDGINITMNIYDLVYPPAEIKPAHQVDIFQEDLIINVTGFTKDTLLQSISWFPSGSLAIPTESPTIRVFVNGTLEPNYDTVNLNNKNLEILIEQGYFNREKLAGLPAIIELRLKFNEKVSDGNPFVLENIAIPPLSPAVLEVKVW